jgi:glycosyltransferase involved in cell wall biosynthesis
MRQPEAGPLVVHVFPTFAVGGAQVRFCALANRFGPRWRHVVIAMDGRTDCAERLSPAVPIRLVLAPVPAGLGISRFTEIRRVLRRLHPDVLVTSNWGSIEWAMVARTFPTLHHIHTEDGFGPDEASGQKLRRVLVRRLVLRQSEVVLPSVGLLHAARGLWHLPEARLHYIPNGLDLDRFNPAGPGAGLDVPGEGPLIGTVAKLRAEKNVARLLRAVALLHRRGITCRLAVIGDGPEKPGLERLAQEIGIAGSVRFTGHQPAPSAAYRSMDIFALSSDTEQMPFSILEAMASGLPVASTDVGDVRAMLPQPQGSFVVAKDETALAGALAALVGDADLRGRLGAANRAKANQQFDQEAMFKAYADLIDHGLSGAGVRRMTEKTDVLSC